MSSSSVWHVALESKTGESEKRQQKRERDKNTQHSESVDISVSSQESQSVLEMTEDWKMLSLFMQSAGSRRVDGEYSENTLALFHLTGARVSVSLTWKTVTQIPKAKR